MKEKMRQIEKRQIEKKQIEKKQIEKMKQIISVTKELFDLYESDMKPIDDVIDVYTGDNTKDFLKLIIESKTLSVKQKTAISFMIGAFFAD